MARIKVTRRGRMRVDHAEAARAAVQAILKHMDARVRSERDVDDRPLPGYSEMYARQRAAIGATSSQGARLASLLRGLKCVRVTTTGGRTTMVFDVGNARVTSTPRPPPWVFDRSKTADQQARALERWRRAPKRTKSHGVDVVLRWLASRGQSDRRPRRLIGISARGRADVIKAVERARVFRGT